MFSDSDSEGSTTPDECPPVQASSQEENVEAENSTTAQIKLLHKMSAEGLIAKKDLSQMIMQILSKTCVNNVPKANSRKRKVEEAPSSFDHKALRTEKKFRRTASPETTLIRKIIESPVERRFQSECAKQQSALFGKVPPKRLREDVFEVACKSPLEEIYTVNAMKLKDVASNKVMHVIKWKIRKMRANRLPAKHHVGDNFDFDAVARELDDKLFVQNAAKRRREFFYKKKKSTTSR